MAGGQGDHAPDWRFIALSSAVANVEPAVIVQPFTSNRSRARSSSPTPCIVTSNCSICSRCRARGGDGMCVTSRTIGNIGLRPGEGRLQSAELPGVSRQRNTDSSSWANRFVGTTGSSAAPRLTDKPRLPVSRTGHHGPVEIVNEETHRVLAYVDALNRHGVRPPRALVDEFAEAPEQKVRMDGGIRGLAQLRMVAATFAERYVPDETFSEYLSRLGWIGEVSDAVELTAIGRALLKALNSPVLEEGTADVFEIVLDPDNPFAYVQALHGVSSVSDALLVEPYFRLQQLMDVAEFDNIVRVLVGSRLKTAEYELLATGLASLPEDRIIEIRKASDLHDRYLIPAVEGAVLMLGASLGGIGKNVSTMTTLGDLASQALRDAHERLWAEAEPIRPKKLAAAPHPPMESPSTPPKKATTSTAKKTARKS